MSPSGPNRLPTFVAGESSLRSLSCCNEHPSTYQPLPFKRSRLRNCLAATLSFVADEKLSNSHTIRSTHPWIPIHLSYNHMACLANELPSDKGTPQKIMSLSAEGYSWRRKSEMYADVSHHWGHDLFYIGGLFIQHLRSSITFARRDHFYTEKFRNCPHSSFTIEGLRRSTSSSRVNGRFYGAGTPESYVDLRSEGKYGIICGVCKTEATCDITVNAAGNIKVDYTCVRKLGTGQDFTADWHWHFLMTPYNSCAAVASHFPMLTMLEQTSEQMVRFPAQDGKHRGPSKRGSGVGVDWDMVERAQKQNDVKRVQEIKQAKANACMSSASGLAIMLLVGLCN